MARQRLKSGEARPEAASSVHDGFAQQPLQAALKTMQLEFAAPKLLMFAAGRCQAHSQKPQLRSDLIQARLAQLTVDSALLLKDMDPKSLRPPATTPVQTHLPAHRPYTSGTASPDSHTDPNAHPLRVAALQPHEQALG